MALASRGDMDGAEEPFLQAVAHDPSAKNFINLARLHQAKGRMPEAKAAMAQAQALQ